MDALRQQLARIQQQLAGLSASQKMLTFALVAIMVMTLFGWSRFAATGDKVSIISGNVTDDDLLRATEALAERGVNFTASGKSILVPVDERRLAMATLAQKQVLSSSGSDSFLTIISDASPFATSKTVDARLQYAQQQEVTQILKSFDNVTNASVMLNLKEKRAIGAQVETSANINLSTRNHDMSPSQKRELALSAVNLVSRGCGIASKNVTISINTKVVRLTDGTSDFSGADYLERLAAFEAYMTNSVAAQFDYIDGLRCTVRGDVEHKSTVENKHAVDATNKIAQIKSETTETSNTASGARNDGGQPGATPNVGIDVNATSGGTPGNSSSTETAANTYDNDHGTSDSWTNSPMGKGTITGVTIQMPRSFLSRVYRSRNPESKEMPTGTEFKAFIEELTAEYAGNIAPIVAVKADMLKVSAYDDLEPLVDAAAAAAPGVASNLISQYGKQAVLGVLAIASLAMVARMVKKAGPITTPGPVLAGIGMASPSSRQKGPPVFAGDMLHGEAAEAPPPMMGQELDEQVIETSQMIDQVSTLVKDNPEAAAKLIKRWMNRV